MSAKEEPRGGDTGIQERTAESGSRSRGLLFYRMLEQALMAEPVTLVDITRKDKHNI